MRIVLASASPRRKELMELVRLKFEIQPSNIEEILDERLSVPKRIEKLSFQKASDVAGKLNEESIVIGADTVVELDGKILGKPKDKEDAKDMLIMLSGNTHNVITAISVLKSNDPSSLVTAHEITEVKFKKLTEQEIENYVNTGEPLDKAGAYAIQGIGVLLVEKINGCYTNVVGLPIPLLTRKLSENFGITLL